MPQKRGLSPDVRKSMDLFARAWRKGKARAPTMIILGDGLSTVKGSCDYWFVRVEDCDLG